MSAASGLIQVILQDGIMTRALVPGRYLVGHTDLCELRLQDPHVAARHAQLVISDMALVVDLSGSTGTYVNGERIHGPRTLSNGDRLRLGSHEFTVWLRPLQRAVTNPASGEHALGLAPLEIGSDPAASMLEVARSELTPAPAKPGVHESGTRRIVSDE